MNPTLPSHTVRLCHLYPERMNIYADRGNIAVFANRLKWRGMSLEIREFTLGDSVDPSDHDLYYLGGGQDRDQDLVAGDLAHKADALRAGADDGAAQLYVCGGIQLAGHRYQTASGESLAGVGVLDLETVAGSTRLVGDIAISTDLCGPSVEVVGYENHAGRTHLGDVSPFGQVISGHGNNDADKTEGATRDRVIGTYLHGPLLPKNPQIADLLLSWALEHRYGGRVELAPLDDTLEKSAHAVARTRVGLDR